jgi:hypothetical protein
VGKELRGEGVQELQEFRSCRMGNFLNGKDLTFVAAFLDANRSQLLIQRLPLRILTGFRDAQKFCNS